MCNYLIPEFPEDIHKIKPLIICDKILVIADLASYGENDITKSILAKKDDEYSAYYKRLSWLADWFIFNHPSKNKRSSITFALAFTLAAIYISERKYRLPNRSRRKLIIRKKIGDLNHDYLIMQYLDSMS